MTSKIAIIGAGPGGCMLARLLARSSTPIATKVFESEASINYRSQGGTLDLRTDTGLAAIKQAGLWDEFQKHARYDGEYMLVTDKNLTTWMKRAGRKAGQDGKQQLQEAPEIDRADLRRILMESLPLDSVRWGYKLSRVEETPSGLSLHFANGEVLSGFDLIVGCDGAFSKARSFLSAERPCYTGLGGWTMYIPHAATTAPEVAKLVNRGSVFAYSDQKVLNLQQLTENESVYVSHYGPYPENFSKTCGFDASNLNAAKVALRKDLEGWRPEFLDAVEKSEGDCVWRNLYQLPVGFTWEHKQGITLLGDAAHVMTPFAGIGVNTAFFDALELSRQIIAHATSSQSTTSLDEHVIAYERVMFAHAHDAQRLTEGSKNDMLFTPGAPRTSIESWVLRHAKSGMPGWSHGVVTLSVYAGYWVYKWFV